MEAQVCGRMRGAWHHPRPRRLQAAARVRRGGEVSRGPCSGVMGVSAAQGAWRGAVSTHPSGQGSGP